MNELMDRLDQMDRPQCLCHIDANVDNFLMFEGGSAKLLDWEYAGMCDPVMDISMSAIYSYYDAEQTEKLLEIYLKRKPSKGRILFRICKMRPWAVSSGACGLYTRQL